MRSLLILLALSLAVMADDKSPSAPAKSAHIFQMRLVVDAASPDSEEMVQMTHSNNPTDWPTLHVQQKVLIDETSLKNSYVAADLGGEPSIYIQFTDEGAKRFADVTKASIQKRLAIVIDGTLYSAPNIMEQITGGVAKISGRFSTDEARHLAAKINASLKK
jgi:preprotein translocase subunit SecD